MTSLPWSEEHAPLDWPRFVATYWDRRPVVYRRQGAPLYPVDAVLRGAVAAARADTADAPAYRFVLDGRQAMRPGPWLPGDDDRSFEGFARRIAGSGAATREYALIVNNFHHHDVAVWNAGRRFFHALWEQVGLPATGVITTLFHGNYERTPIGVHKDRFATFLFVLQGRKRMRFWPGRPWHEAVTTWVDYAQYMADSFAIEVEPGDILYWPSSYYHVGETVDPAFSTSVNVGIPRDGHRLAYDLDGFVQATASLQRTVPTSQVDAIGGDLPASAAHALAEVRQQLSPQALRSGAVGSYLSLLSACGFVPPPPRAAPRRLEDSDHLRLVDPALRIVWSRDDHGIVCAASGHLHRVHGLDAAVVSLVRRLHEASAIHVGDVLASLRMTDAQVMEIRLLLEWLLSTRVLERVGSGVS